jgi:hypothetical protein
MNANDTEVAALAPSRAELAAQQASLPKLLTPRQFSARVVGMVLLAELVMFAGWFVTGMPWLTVTAMCGGLFAWGIRRRGDVHRALTSSERARELLERGNTDDAAQLLDELLTGNRTPPNVRPFPAYYRALVAIRRGDFDEARVRLQAVVDSGWLGNRRTLQTLAPAVYASAMMIAVLDGDLVGAERWRSEGQRCAANLDRHWFVPDAFLLARRNAWTDLLRKLETSWDAIEGTVSGVGIRQLQMLEAYALARLGEREDNYRGHHSGREISALLSGIRPGRFDYLARRWPELREFMLAHHLLAPE